MKQIAPRAVLAISSALCAASLCASDRWETPSDNGAYTNNALHHGLVQGPHDLESPDATPDEDWYEVAMQAGHSYEIMVFGGAVWAYLNCPDCGAFDRVDPQGNVLTPGSNEGHDEGAELAVRWIAESDGIAWFRARLGPGYPDPSQNYDITLWETTCFLPRFNNSGSQVTVLVVQNTLNRPNQGEIHFFDAAGGELDVEALSLPPRGVSVINTAQIPALSGKSGSARIAHLGGFGALTGKAVSVESATGMALETQLSTLP